MFRFLTVPSAWELWKWCAYALLLLVPGSLIAIPALWLVRTLGARAKKGSIKTACTTSSEAKPSSVLQRIRRWWTLHGTGESYLCEATDLADLERRIRVLERASGGPVFVTFNH